MAKTLSIITNSMNGGLPVQNQGLKLSKIIAIEKIEEHERFKELYSIDEDLLNRIADDMRENKFDASQPVHLWITSDDDGTEHFYLIDGYTRITAARLAGLVTVPYFEHHFDSFEEAHRYALHLQVDRRNLSGMDLLKNIEELMGSDYIQNMKGNKNAIVGEMLGVSEKTVERANFVEKNASDEQKAEIESGEATINATYNNLKKQEFVEKNASDEQKERIESGNATVEEIYDEIKEEQKSRKSDRHVSVEGDSASDIDAFDDLSDALEDTSGDPKGIVIGDHSDHIERPTNKLSAEEDSERTRERRKAYETGFMEGFLQAANYVLMLVLHGQANSAIYIDIFCNEHYHNYEHFKLCDGDDGVYAYEYNQFRKALLAERPNLKDLNEIALKDYDRNNTEETAESTDTETDDAFDIEFEDGEE